MKKILSPIAAAFVVSIAATPLAAAENPFSVSDLASGYSVALGDKPEKAMEEGKCGGSKKNVEEGKCGTADKSGKVMEEGKKAMEEGKCGGSKKNMEEGKCGGK